MQVFKVQGLKPLHGKIKVQGAKNAVLPMMAVSLLTEGRTEIRNVPRISDVFLMAEILRDLGCQVMFQDDVLEIDASGLSGTVISEKSVGKMRSSSLLLGPLLSRAGEVTTWYPGGCVIGKRPIDFHLDVLRAMGAEILDDGGMLIAKAETLCGTTFRFPYPSVGATENAVMAAVLASGTTKLLNCAREPEIADLQDFLCACGAEVRGAGGSVITVEGCRPLHGCVHRVIPDRIVTATYLCAAAACGGDILLRGTDYRHLATVTTALQQAGCRIDCGETDIRLRSEGRLQAVTPVRTAPYPGFPTDCQAVLMAALLRSRGTTVFVENIFESRYRHAAEMQRMGADIRVEGRVAVVCGVERLHAADVFAADLRGGAALVIAALQAEGCSAVHQCRHIQRGYADLAGDLAGLGARVRQNTE